MSKLSDAKSLANDEVFIFYLHDCHLIIGKCTEIDEDRMLVRDPYYISIMVQPNGRKASALFPMVEPSIASNAVSYFHYKDILSIYAPLEQFKHYYLYNVSKAQMEKYMPSEEDDEKEDEPTGEKVIHVDFKSKKRKSTANQDITIVTTEETANNEPDPKEPA